LTKRLISRWGASDSMKSGGLLRHTRIVAGGFVALFTLSVMNSAYSNVLATIKEDLSLSYTLSGALMSSYFFGYMLGQIPWGVLADRRGGRRAMALSVAGVSASTALFGLSSNFLVAVSTRFLAGLLGAGVFVPAVRLVSGWFSPGERGTALGILTVGGSVGLIASSWAAPFLSLVLGWKGSMAALGSLGVMAAALVWRSLKDPVEESSYERRGDLSEALRSRSFWLLGAVQFFRLGSYYTFVAWLPLLLREEHGFSLVMAGTALSLFNLAGIAANPLGGLASDRVGEGRVLLASFALLALDVLLFTGLGAGPLIYASIFLLGWFINFVRTPSFTIIPKLFGPEAAGGLSGVHNTFASLGAFALPLLLGYVRDQTLSYDAGWVALSGLMFVGAALTLMIGGRGKDRSRLAAGGIRERF
jgi:predicted MFS family arabinose efflux permease